MESGDFFSEMIDIDQYVRFLEDNISENPETISFRFNNNLKADKGDIEGKIIGEIRKKQNKSAEKYKTKLPKKAK